MKDIDKFRQQVIAKAGRGECEGACIEHSGEVRPVRVMDGLSGADWGYFSYCEEARRIDTENGMFLKPADLRKHDI